MLASKRIEKIKGEPFTQVILQDLKQLKAGM